MDERIRTVLAGLPKIDEVMLRLERRGIYGKARKDIVRDVCRSVVACVRERVKNQETETMSVPTADDVADEVERTVDALHRYRLRRVINATGIVLHTNLGRAPLCEEAVERIAEVARGYSNLEYDLDKGQRGLRYDHVDRILCTLSAAEDSLVVNNNAAAVLLVLNTLAEGREVVVSRGELIEIGGEFRIPDIMKKSGAVLREVGTTNRTRLSDYETAISADTGLILKVHPSNYRIVGFTESVALPDLVALGKRRAVPVMDDLGSGCFLPLDRFGLDKEPTIPETIATGVDVVTFSGDKLLGGPQAGIILGRRDILREVKKNSLNRALRIDKFTLAALEATLLHYLVPEHATVRLRALRSLTEPVSEVARRAKRLLRLLRRVAPTGMVLSLKKGTSLAGGGSLPSAEIPTFHIAARSAVMSTSTLEQLLRGLPVPIIARICDDTLLLDLRTIDEREFPCITEGFSILADRA
jgi:L-seryl-tRNA(Ser) seleniumtransferase